MRRADPQYEYRFWTYIVASLTGTLYVGMTNNIERRAWEHKNGIIEGFAKRYGCTRLVWYERFSHALSAIGREKQIKGYTRAKKIALIEATNPRWADLAESWGRPMLMPNQSIREYEEQQRKRKVLPGIRTQNG